jgi:uncharacterized membrane protein HdeD (DUF308 family)
MMKEESMLGILRQHWWVLALRGLFAVLFGICAIVWPGLTVGIFVALFGAYAIVNGLFTLIAGLRGGAGVHRLSLIIQGAFSVIVGILVWVWPGLTALALLYWIAIWAIIVGVMEITSAVQLRKEIANEWFLGIAGALSILFGLICFVHPASGALAVVWLIGIYAILFGVTLIGLGFRLRGMGDHLGAAAPRGV